MCDAADEGACKMAAYDGFAGIYDLLMDDFDYPAWAEYYLRLIAEMGVHPKTMCDCACGTGSMTLEFAGRGIAVTGADISQEMLERAAQKARQRGVRIPFVCQDMCQLKLPRPVDAIVCACDGVNYLTSDKRLRAFFRAAREQLREGGVLAFDVSSPHKLRDVLGERFYGEERDEAAYLWQNTIDGDCVNMDISFFIREADGRYRRVVENHRQRIQEPAALKNLLEECGFTDVRVLGDRNFDPPKPEEMRVHVCARRE